MPSFTGVDTSSIGTTYDVAIGYNNNDVVHMVGYVLALGQKWQESTDIQDETHIVQISTLSTDRFARYPQQSQGDWSGGERQIFAPGSSAFQTISFNEYYRNDGNVNATIPGNLQLFPGNHAATLTGGDGVTQYCPIGTGTDGNVFIGFRTPTTNLSVANFAATQGIPAGINPVGIPAYSIAGNNAIVAMVPGYEDPVSTTGIIIGLTGVSANTNTGIQFVQGGPPASITNQYCNDIIAPQIGHSVAVLPTIGGAVAGGAGVSPVGNIYFIPGNNNAALQTIKWVSLSSTAGNVPAPNVLTTIPGPYGQIQGIWSTGSTLTWVTYAPSTLANVTYVWQSDGTTSGSLIGVIGGQVIGGGDYNGTLYLVSYIAGALSVPSGYYAYAIYSVDVGIIKTFDDVRDLDSNFLALVQLGPAGSTTVYQSTGTGVIGDGRYLYLSIPGAPTRFYDLTQGGNPIFQYMGSTVASNLDNGTICTGLASPAPLVRVGPIALGYDPTRGTAVLQQSVGNEFTLGTQVLSWLDFGAPQAIKRFRSVTIELVNPLPNTAKVVVNYAVDNGPVLGPLPLIDDPPNVLLFTFPLETKGYRVQLYLTMETQTSSPWTSPVIQYVTVKATLGRAWKFTVSCVRNQSVRNTAYAPGEDPQGLTAQQKLANIINVYEVAAGNMTMYIPSPTCTAPGTPLSTCVANGVEKLKVVLEDYQWVAGLEQPGPYNTEYGAQDMEGYMQLTVVESI